jgi:hypothetical protein
MWARSLSKAPLTPSPVEAFYHGLVYAFRTGDAAAQGRLFTELGEWYGRSRQPLEAGHALLRGAAVLSPYALDITGEPKEGIDAEDASRYAVEVRRGLDRARRAMLHSVKGQNDLFVALEGLSNAAIDIEIEALRG